MVPVFVKLFFTSSGIEIPNGLSCAFWLTEHQLVCCTWYQAARWRILFILLYESKKPDITGLDDIKLLTPWDTFDISASAPHSLQVLDDFCAYVVLAAGAQVKFTAF